MEERDMTCSEESIMQIYNEDHNIIAVIEFKNGVCHQVEGKPLSDEDLAFHTLKFYVDL